LNTTTTQELTQTSNTDQSTGAVCALVGSTVTRDVVIVGQYIMCNVRFWDDVEVLIKVIKDFAVFVLYCFVLVSCCPAVLRNQLETEDSSKIMQSYSVWHGISATMTRFTIHSLNPPTGTV